jgi:hypothetical protein
MTKISQHARNHAANNHGGISKHWADGRPRSTCAFDGMPLDHRQCSQCNADTAEGVTITMTEDEKREWSLIQ